jgi:hypothetical protein
VAGFANAAATIQSNRDHIVTLRHDLSNARTKAVSTTIRLTCCAPVPSTPQSP